MKKFNLTKIFSIIFYIISVSFFTVIAKADIELSEVKARASMGELKSSALYLNIENKTSDSDILTGATSEVAEICEIHKIVENNNIHQMVRIDKLLIPANNKISLAPHNIHIMLINLKKKLVAGDKFEVTLNFEKAGNIKVEALVTNINDSY